MSAYLIFTRKQTLDEAELNIYWDKIRATFAGHEVRILVNYGRYEVLEGDTIEGIVIAEFPSFEAAGIAGGCNESIAGCKHSFSNVPS